MLKSSKKKIQEVDIFYIIKILWEGKLKIISLTIITTLIAVYYNYMQPGSYGYKAKISKSQRSVFSEYTRLNQILLSNSLTFKVNPESIFKSFLHQVNDYNAVVSFLSDEPSFKLILSNLDDSLKQKALLKYTESFKISLDPKLEVITVEFEWLNGVDGRKIFENFMKKFLEKVKLEIIGEAIQAKEIINSINNDQLKSLNFEMKNILEYEKKRIARELLILEDNYRIAKILNIENFSKSQNNLIVLKDYERGFKVIEEEMNVLKNSSDEDLVFKSFDYLRLIKKKNDLQVKMNKDSLIDSIENLKKDSLHDWVDYSTLNMDIQNLSIAKRILIFGVIFGLLVGSLYIIIRDAIPGLKIIK